MRRDETAYVKRKPVFQPAPRFCARWLAPHRRLGVPAISVAAFGSGRHRHHHQRADLGAFVVDYPTRANPHDDLPDAWRWWPDRPDWHQHCMAGDVLPVSRARRAQLDAAFAIGYSDLSGGL